MAALLAKAEILKAVDGLFGPLLCRLFARPRGPGDYPPLESVPGPVLVIRPGGIGDAVMLLPMLAALREALPGREVDVLCESRNRHVLQFAQPAPRRILTYDREPLTALRHIRRSRYAVVFDTEQYHHFSGVLAAWTHAPVRVGFKINAKRNALYTHLVSYDLDGPEDVQFGRLLAAVAGGRVPTLPRKHGLIPKDAALPELPESLAAALRQGPVAVLHAGGSAAAKRWPNERYAELCGALAAGSGLRPILVGGPADQPFAADIARCAGDTVLNACGVLTLAQTAALCRRSTVFVGPDSGIAHLASAVGTPCVVLFGPSDPLKWGPREGGRAVLCPVPCGPCAIFGYNKPCRAHACMEGITVGKVLQAVSDVSA